MGRVLRAVLALAAIAGAAACSLVYGPSDGLSAGAASSTSSSGAPPDGSTSSSSSSSSSTSSSSGGFACPAGALVCTDFESGMAPFSVRQGGLGFVDGGRDSAKALEAVLESNEPSPYVSAVFTPETKVGTFAFWFKPDGVPPHATITFRLASALWGEPCDWQLSWQIYLRKDGLFAGTDSYDEDVNPSCGPIEFETRKLLDAARVYDGNWHHVTVVMDATARSRTARTQVDDDPAIDVAVDSGRDAVPAEVDLAIGIPCIQEGSGCFEWEGATYRVRFDDVTFTATK